MDLKIGDSIELESGEKYAIIMDVLLNEKKYYLISNEKNISEILVVQIDGEDVNIVKDKKEIEEAINAMTEIEN